MAKLMLFGIDKPVYYRDMCVYSIFIKGKSHFTNTSNLFTKKLMVFHKLIYAVAKILDGNINIIFDH